MAIYRVQGPDGAIHRFEGPDDATPQQIEAFAAQQFGAQSSEPAPQQAEPPNERNPLAETALGALRGAQGIGNTLIDAATLPFSGIDAVKEFRDWRHDGQDQLDKEHDGSSFYTLGRVGTELAGTAGAGGLLAKGARAIPAIVRAAPNLVRAVETSGLLGGNLGTRAAGGAIAGAAQTALVDPNASGAGAAIGGAAPVLGRIGGAIGSAIGRKAASNPQTLKAAQEAAAHGYVIPPSDVQPQGLLMEALGGLSGKIKTAQEASARNQSVTNNLARKELGLSGEGPITRQDFSALKAPSFALYDEAEQTSPLAKAAVAEWRKANFEAGRQAKFYGRSFDPKAQDAADTARQEAAKWAAVIEQEAANGGRPGLAQELAAARVNLGKIGTVERLTNKATGDVSATKIGGLLDRGQKLSGGLLDIAKAQQAFPKATQTLKESPKAISPLDWAVALGAGADFDEGKIDPRALGLLALRPAARKALLSKAAQKRAMRGLLNAQPQSSLTYRLAPQLGLLTVDQ